MGGGAREVAGNVDDLGVTALQATHIGGPTRPARGGRLANADRPNLRSTRADVRIRLGDGSRKVAGPANLAAGEIGPIDAVLLTHEHHGDNLDPTGRTLLPDAGAVITTQSGAERLGGGRARAAAWETRGPRPGRTAANRDHGNAVPPRPAFSHPLVGDVIGFALGHHQEHGVCGSRATRCSTTK